MAPHIANFLLGSFGIVAAVLLIGGSIALRWQRQRQQHDLARRAIDAGLPLPATPPLWLALRRHAVSILAVGIGLIAVGVAAWSIGSNTAMPTDAGDLPSTQAVDLAALIEHRPPTPPRPSAAMEAWHAAQERVVVGQSAVGCGVILTLLGIARLGFSVVERRYAAE